MTRLTSLQAPAYRGRPWRQRHVHIGLGAFSRAHIGAYSDQLLREGYSDWGIIGANLRSDELAGRLLQQDGLYTLVESNGAGATARVLGAIAYVLGGSDLPVLIERLASPEVSFVTVTVTEKGYGYDARRCLDLENPVIAGDLGHPGRPSSLVGVLVEALYRRYQTKAPPLTIVSCDNIDNNGGLLRDLVVTFAEGRDTSLAGWIRRHVAFPSTMVDRIVPATTDRLHAEVEALTGFTDLAPVGAEPFCEWFIENLMAGDYPPLETVGVQVVPDVAPYVQLKLRVLNALHSACSYLGSYQQVRTIDGVVRSNAVFLQRLLEEIVPTVASPAGFDVRRYGEKALERFANPWLGHRCQQVAMDGSVKLPQRLYPTLVDRLDRGLPIDACARVVALWVDHIVRGGKEVDDPHAAELALRLRGARSSADMVQAVLGGTAIVPARLSHSDVVELVAKDLDELRMSRPVPGRLPNNNDDASSTTG